VKLILGTVQFGLAYGVSNTDGKTEESQVLKILDYARNNGINTLDTAGGYGDSEQVIGKLINKYKWNVITKTPNFSGKKIGEDQLRLMNVSFNESLNKLGSIDTLLVHSANDLLKSGGNRIFAEINKLKELDLINKVGVSVYTYKQIDYILENYKVDIIQLPISILDQRLIKSGHLKKIKKYGIEIHARSVFMQGLLLMPLHNLPSYFDKVYNNIDEFIAYASKYSMSNLELALGFVQSLDEVDKVIVGVNTIDQLHEIIEASEVRVNCEKYSNISVSDASYVDPSNWKL